MKDGMFIFDAVVHMLDTRPSNVRNPAGAAAGAMVQ